MHGGAEQRARERDANAATLGDRSRDVGGRLPFCMTMVSDGLKAEAKEEEVRAMDVVELLHQACSLQGR